MKELLMKWYGKGRLIDVQGGYEHGTAYELTTKAWPQLNSALAPPDKDGDGMCMPGKRTTD